MIGGYAVDQPMRRRGLRNVDLPHQQNNSETIPSPRPHSNRLVESRLQHPATNFRLRFPCCDRLAVLAVRGPFELPFLDGLETIGSHQSGSSPAPDGRLFIAIRTIAMNASATNPSIGRKMLTGLMVLGVSLFPCSCREER